jgi:hypothetical protein
MALGRKTMSSILTVYRMAESKRTDFEHAYANEKKVTYKSGFFGKKEMVTGDQFLWEHLDDVAFDKIDFGYSGFVFIDYFFTYVVLPDETRTRLNSASRGEHYYVIDAALASSIRDYLLTHRPSIESLTAFAKEEGKMEDGYPEVLLSTHDQIVELMALPANDIFLVIHLTF